MDARTAIPGWLGEHLDVGYAIDVLHPLAAGPAPMCPVDGMARKDLSFCGSLRSG